ncbi:helix-turn-helix transcriptional regulator, partial [Arcanobacterium phocae]|uniref:helix-turn-helix transcriptional regulator n=1 Tax=Arcanobacterium phocae TaxID=131112 RepID=UPI001C0EA737
LIFIAKQYHVYQNDKSNFQNNLTPVSFPITLVNVNSSASQNEKGVIMEKELALTDTFRQRIKNTGMTQEALAKAIGISRQFFNDIWTGKQVPTATFMTGALRAGLGESLADIAEWQPKQKTKTAA